MLVSKIKVSGRKSSTIMSRSLPFTHWSVPWRHACFPNWGYSDHRSSDLSGVLSLCHRSVISMLRVLFKQEVCSKIFMCICFNDALINFNSKSAWTEWSKLAHNDIFWNPRQQIFFRKHSSFQKNLNSLLKWTLTKRTTAFNSIDSMSGDWSQLSSMRHYVNQSRNVSIVHIDSVAWKLKPQLIDQTFPGSFYSKNV